jgi:ADP-heptose:LPS heptosyltransferase
MRKFWPGRMQAEAKARRIAVIKLGALGDVVQALGPMQAIRTHHAADRITLVTTRPYAAFLRASGLFDEVWDDGRARSLKGFLALIARMRRARFDRVYDLQTSTRSSTYFWLLWPRLPEWSGVAFLASHPHANPRRVQMHTVDRQAEQLAMAGIAATPPADLSFAKADLARFALPARYAVLVPGGSAHRPAKRWPAIRYGELARHLMARGITPVIIGTGAERALAATIIEAVPEAIDLTDETDFFEIATLGRGAELAVGNDTGPMHLLAAAGAPSVVLFSAESDPARCAPRGASVRALQVSDLATLPLERVLAAAGA